MTTRRCRGSSPPLDGAPLELEGIPPAAIARCLLEAPPRGNIFVRIIRVSPTHHHNNIMQLQNLQLI